MISPSSSLLHSRSAPSCDRFQVYPVALYTGSLLLLSRFFFSASWSSVVYSWVSVGWSNPPSHHLCVQSTCKVLPIGPRERPHQLHNLVHKVPTLTKCSVACRHHMLLSPRSMVTLQQGLTFVGNRFLANPPLAISPAHQALLPTFPPPTPDFLS